MPEQGGGTLGLKSLRQTFAIAKKSSRGNSKIYFIELGLKFKIQVSRPLLENTRYRRCCHLYFVVTDD